MSKIGVVGHIAIDKVITNEGERVQLGGPPTYITTVAQLLGEKPTLATKAGDDIMEILSQSLELDIDLKNKIVEDSKTTCFHLDYQGPKRILKVVDICEELKPHDMEDLPDTVLISPIVNEIPSSTLNAINPEILALDPQGFIRDVKENGDVDLRKWSNLELLKRLRIYKSTEEELTWIVTASDTLQRLEKLSDLGIDIVIVTRGAEGAILASDGVYYLIPTKTEHKVVDPTGAGDVFIGAFLLEYLKGEDTVWAASLANAFASYVVETEGSKIHATRKQINKRAEKIYEQSIKI